YRCGVRRRLRLRNLPRLRRRGLSFGPAAADRDGSGDARRGAQRATPKQPAQLPDQGVGEARRRRDPGRRKASLMDEGTVIIGAGHAGTGIAAALRAEGYEGTITLLSAEDETPYHRPPLSKTFLKADADQAPLLRPATFYCA